MEKGKDGVCFHLDYLKITVFAELDEVENIVESALLEKAGLELRHWKDKGSAQRWEHILEGPGPVYLMTPKDSRITYTVIELRGQGCTSCGSEALLAFLAYIVDCGLRWHGLRADLAFDHVRFTPAMVDAAIRKGDFNSRCLSIADRAWTDSETGKTSYLGRRDQRTKQRRLRVYDQRGFVRCEAELHGDWASSAIRMLAKGRLQDWSQIALGHLRGMVDFVDRSADERAERCPLLPWWAELVGDAKRIRNLPEEDRRQKRLDDAITVIGKSEMRIIRAARSLWPMIEAFGEKYVLDRLEYYCRERLRVEDREFAEELKLYRYSGRAGLPDHAPCVDDVPF